MAGRRALKAINWGALAERVPEHEKLNFAAFKAKSEQYLKRAEEFPAEAPKIDWAYYKKNIAKPGLVDKFQKEYENLKISFPEDKYTAKITEQEKKVNAYIEQFVAESNARIEKSLADQKHLEGMMKYGDMTMEDFYTVHPELAVNKDRPSIYPHTPEFQPGPDDDKQQASHH